DQIIDLAAVRSPTTPVRIGIPGDFGGKLLPAALAEFRRRFPHQGFQVRCDISDRLLLGLENGDIDLAVTCAPPPQPIEAYDRWTESVVWVRGPSATYDPNGPVPLVAQDEDCILTKLVVEALDRAGREWEMVFTGPSSVSVAGAVAAGLGISAMVERLVSPELTVWRDAPLAPLPDITCGIYLREGHERGLLEELAEALAKVIRPERASAGASIVDRQAGKKPANPPPLTPLIDRAIGCTRQKRRIEHVGRFRLGLEGVGKAELIDGLFEAHVIDGAESVRLHFRGKDVVTQR